MQSGMLDDEYTNFTHQIMWYGNMKTYARFYDIPFALMKLGDQLSKPENRKMEQGMLYAKKKTIYFFGNSKCELH
ncbi:hypothetical protein HYO65_gp198 [Tenacibaculum phage PTm1]|uniref:Uncharacterized protein n=1 Tax=Tenacibaculum phage PTm1 TaxID=2547425 RepID=A0A5S9BZ49_9CAUD|nr:hypothetical protein HYO65_gp198 [Tenacibaculum phage PTm1]BBI90590.1 hypothetical protein [Tenacibaculum phage PTm1]